MQPQDIKVHRSKFTKNAIAAIDFANKVCLRLGASEMNLDHLFMGILSVKEGVGARVLARLGLDPDATISSIEEELKKSLSLNSSHENNQDNKNTKVEVAEVYVSQDVKTVFKKAFEHAINSGHTYVGTEHLLLGVLDSRENYFVKELNNLGITYERVKAELDSMVQYPDFVVQDTAGPVQQPSSQDQKKSASGGGFFANFGRNLTLEAKMGKLDPVFGRENEINRLMQILSRKTKNNPILLGDAGVGKTAIVEGLAYKIANGEVSPVLANYEIWSIDTASIVAGSQLRGDVESKVLDMIHEIESRGNVILFIDEIHTILGAGSTSNNPLDIANILKPALARGALHCIGATTVDEYKKHFDEDPALKRRFQPVDVEELSGEETYKILQGLKKVYESFHDVKITDEALKAAVKLSSRYITDRYLPDKAIDVIDEACARNKINRIRVSDEFKGYLDDLKGVVEQKRRALEAKKIEEAADLLEKEQKMMRKLAKMEADLRASWSKANNVITENDIRAIVSQWSKVPLDNFEQNAADVIKRLEHDLMHYVIGQEHAVKAVVNAIKRAKAGLSGFDRPLASFLFVGPTGVGKTELAKRLAESLFGSKESLIQVDMSEFMETHSVSKLIGSPPGYVGFDQGGQLTDKVRRRPFSVVLFDEIEKASPEVLNIMLQILDEGRLTDSKGKSVNFKNTIIIMTSNVGAEFLHKDSVLGIYLGEKKVSSRIAMELDQALIETREKIIDALREFLQPEFINRIDDIVVFRELSRENIAEITKLHIRELVERIREENKVIITGADSQKIVDFVIEMGYSEEYGAREIKRVIKSFIEGAIADKMLELGWSPESKEYLHLGVVLSKGKIQVVKKKVQKSRNAKLEDGEKQVTESVSEVNGNIKTF